MMKQRTAALLATGMLSLLLFAAPSFAGDYSAGKDATGAEASRAIGSAAEFKGAKAKPVPGIQADRSASRDVLLDDAAIEKAYTIIGRSSDGRDIKLAPSDEVIDAIKNAKAGGKRTSVEGGGGDPADAASRNIVGPDNRVQISKTTTYPYTAIGYLQMENKKGEVWSCTAALIGPKTAITAANCLYNHGEDGGWREKVVFWPAVNGEDNAPYGGFDYDTEYVFQAYITDFDGSYDGIWQYDVGLVTFKDPIGDTLGYLGYTGEDIGDFQGTLVGYHDDKPAFTMWKSTCNVLAENISPADIVHDCDSTNGTDGAPLYYYDQANKARMVVGINIGPSGDANWALKLNPALVAWINSVNQ
jgi:V8-like Glu-specific endopeptidase